MYVHAEISGMGDKKVYILARLLLSCLLVNLKDEQLFFESATFRLQRDLQRWCTWRNGACSPHTHNSQMTPSSEDFFHLCTSLFRGWAQLYKCHEKVFLACVCLQSAFFPPTAFPFFYKRYCNCLNYIYLFHLQLSRALLFSQTWNM